MSDSRIQRSICQAIEIMTNQKVAQADFDKTKKATIQEVVDITNGRYLVKYQDSIFTAWSVGTNITYSVGDLVIVLSPNGDTSATQIILGSAYPTAKQYSIKDRNRLDYNVLGTNAISMTTDRIELCSYQNEVKVLFNSENDDSENIVHVDQESLRNYIREGNAAVVSYDVETDLDTVQTGGIYGIQVDYLYGIEQEEDSEEYGVVTMEFQLDSRSLEGFPYGKRPVTNLAKPIAGIQAQNFISIKEIRAFAIDFLQEEGKQPDIFISNLSITGAQVFQLEGEDNYLLNIDYSTNGNRLNQNINSILLKALIKIDGKQMTSIDEVRYYWFRQNASILAGDERYSYLAGAGWESIMSLQGIAAVREPVPLKGNNTYTISSIQSKYDKEDFAHQALAVQKVNKFKCVALFDGLKVSGEVFVYNDNILHDIKIVSSDKLANGKNRTQYRMGVGSPTLTCEVDEQLGYNLSYTWVDAPYQRTAKKVEDVTGKVYENYPVKNIIKNTTISCAVKNDKQEYLGTASITLTNVNQLAETYGLVIQNGTQSFKYDENGISPCHPAKQDPLEVQPLSFVLTDPQGMQITYDDLINTGGKVEWYVPKPDSGTLLLANVQSQPSQGTDKAAAAYFNTYVNLKQLPFTIDDTYKENYYLNYIKLNIYYKDLVLSAYTNFTFAKDGDPGTNGTSYLAKIVPQGNTTDRIYGVRDYNQSNLGFFDDSGSSVDKLNNILYYNNQVLQNQSTSWSCPIKQKDKSWLRCNSAGDLSGNNNSTSTPVNIVRGTIAIEQGLKIYSQYPINYNYVYSAAFNENVPRYRFKIQPKTGFKYVKYSEDGTSPSYNNSFPFKVFLEELVGNTYAKYLGEYECKWTVLGNLKSITEEWSVKDICSIEPKDTFDGNDLTSAIKVFFRIGETQLGFLHIPIYMYINRYNHKALNDWDGNSIDLGQNSGAILSPQIGAGKKEEDNSFTGVFMGEVSKGNSLPNEVGLMGYKQGQRTIFLDAQTGKAEFGKNNAAKIIIDPSSNTAIIKSGNYSTTNKTGLQIDLTTPQIRYGSGNFIVDKDGKLTAKGGGQIAGWKIGNNTLTSNNNHIILDSTGNTTIQAKNGNGNTVFSVSNNGYLTATSGKIGGWTIGDTTLTGGGTTFNSNGSINSNNKFKVDINGKLTATEADISGKVTATSGEIGGWDIGNTTISSGNLKLDSGGTITGGTGGTADANWAINANGTVTFRSGTIGGVSFSPTGGLSGTGWYILPGSAHFTGLDINLVNGTMNTGGSGGGITTGGGGYLGSGGMRIPTNATMSDNKTLDQNIYEKAGTEITKQLGTNGGIKNAIDSAKSEAISAAPNAIKGDSKTSGGSSGNATWRKTNFVKQISYNKGTGAITSVTTGSMVVLAADFV